MRFGVNLAGPLGERIRALYARPIVRDVVLPFFVVRIALLAVGVAASRVFPRRPGLVAYADPFVDALVRWDAEYYLGLAQDGYGNRADAFFPAYPALVRVVGLVMPLPYAAVLVAQGMALLAYALLHRYVRREHGEALARRSVEVALLFPTAFFLGAAYAESTYLALLLGAFVAWREARPSLALWCVFFACLARPQGFLCATVPFVLGWAVESRRRATFPFFVVASGAALALLLALHVHASGDPLGFLHARSVQSLGVFRGDVPPPPVLSVLRDEGFSANLVRRLLNLWALALVTVTVIVAVRRRRADEAAVVALTVALPLGFQHTVFDAASMARYAALAFPVYPLIASFSMDGERRRAVDTGFTMAQVVLFAAFAGWYWVE